MYVKDVDASFKRAIEAGASVNMPVKDMFWGDRIGQVIDPFGLVWCLATHVEDLTQEEIARRGEEVYATMAHAEERRDPPNQLWDAE